jgi:hypothetical protein
MQTIVNKARVPRANGTTPARRTGWSRAWACTLGVSCAVSAWLATADAHASSWTQTLAASGAGVGVWDPTAVAVWQNDIVALNWSGLDGNGTVYLYNPSQETWASLGYQAVSIAGSEDGGLLYFVDVNSNVSYVYSVAGTPTQMPTSPTCSGGTFEAIQNPLEVSPLGNTVAKTIAVGWDGTNDDVYVEGSDYHIYWYDNGAACWYQMPALPSAQTPIDLGIFQDSLHTAPIYPWPWVVDANEHMFYWYGYGSEWIEVSPNNGISLGVNNVAQVIGADDTSIWDDSSLTFTKDTSWNEGYIFALGTVNPGYVIPGQGNVLSALIQYDGSTTFTVYYQE